MGLTQLEKMRILRFLKVEEIDANNCDLILQGQKSTKANDILMFLNNVLEKKKNETISDNKLNKLIKSICNLLEIWDEGYIKLQDDTLLKAKENYLFYSDKFPQVETYSLIYNKLLSFSEIPVIVSEEEKKDYELQLLEQQKEIDKLEQALKKLETYVKKNENKLKVALSKKIKSEAEIKELKCQIGLLKAKIVQLCQYLDAEIKKTKNRETDITFLEHQKKRENEKYQKLSFQFCESQEQLKLLTKEFEVLSLRSKELEDTLETQLATIKNLDHENTRLKPKVEAQEKWERKEFIKNKILEFVFANRTSGVTCEMLCNSFLSQGISVSELEMCEVLNHIEVPNLANHSLPPVYTLEKPPIHTNQTLHLALCANQTIDFIFLSDIHLNNCQDFDDKKRSLYKLNNYCVEKGIKYIVNLGDFFHGSNFYQNVTFENYQKIEALLSLLESEFPFLNNGYTILLGGNHDDLLLRFGIDPIKELSKMRADIISIGHTKGYLSFEKENLQSCCFGLFHMKQKNVSQAVLKQDYSSFARHLLQYKGNQITDFDFVGHFHKSLLNPNNNLCFVPSFYHDRTCNGAWHVKMFFDSYCNMSQINFMPLIEEKEFQIVTEIPMQRNLKK